MNKLQKNTLILIQLRLVTHFNHISKFKNTVSFTLEDPVCIANIYIFCRNEGLSRMINAGVITFHDTNLHDDFFAPQIPRLANTSF